MSRGLTGTRIAAIVVGAILIIAISAGILLMLESGALRPSGAATTKPTTTRTARFLGTNIPAQFAFIEAAKTGNLTLVKKMAAANPDLLNAQESSGRSALHAAAWNDRVDIIRYLIDAGADPEIKAPPRDATPLEWATWAGRPQSVKVLIENGATIPGRLLAWCEILARGQNLGDTDATLQNYQSLPPLLRAAGGEEWRSSKFMALLRDEAGVTFDTPTTRPATTQATADPGLRILCRESRRTAEGLELFDRSDYCGEMTEKVYTAPLTIEAEAKTDELNIRLYFGLGEAFFNWEENPKDLHIIDPATAHWQTIKNLGEIPANQFVKLRWEIAPNEMRLYVNDQPRYTCKGKYANVKGRAAIGPAWQSRIVVKSFKITQPPPS